MDFKKETIIMGILNVTPDSFSDGGKYGRIDAALKHAEEMLRDGRDSDTGLLGGVRHAACIVMADIQGEIRADRKFHGIEARRTSPA